jgi:cephalosporin-C deacetylase
MSLLLPSLPPDFDSFWAETSEEALAAPLDFQRKPGNAYDKPGFRVESFTYRSISGQGLQGWIALPEDVPPAPAFLWTPPYGRESLLPNEYGTREGFVSLSFNFFGHEPFHQEKYVPDRGYFAEGAFSQRTWVFRSMFQNALLAARVLREQPEVSGTAIGAMGMSQGAGVSIWLGAFVPFIGAVCADMPFLGGMSQVLAGRVYRYPLKELIDLSGTVPNGIEQIQRTISYFDTLNVATRCVKPTHVTLGLKDPAVKPPSVEAIFEALPGRKLLRRYDVGHDWYPAMVENNRQWLLENLS